MIKDKGGVSVCIDILGSWYRFLYLRISWQVEINELSLNADKLSHSQRICSNTFIWNVFARPPRLLSCSSAMLRMLLQTQSIQTLLHSILRFHYILGYFFIPVDAACKANKMQIHASQMRQKDSWAMRHWWDTFTVKQVEFAFKWTLPGKDRHDYSSNKAGQNREYIATPL